MINKKLYEQLNTALETLNQNDFDKFIKTLYATRNRLTKDACPQYKVGSKIYNLEKQDSKFLKTYANLSFKIIDYRYDMEKGNIYDISPVYTFSEEDLNSFIETEHSHGLLD